MLFDLRRTWSRERYCIGPPGLSTSYEKLTRLFFTDKVSGCRCLRWNMHLLEGLDCNGTINTHARCEAQASRNINKHNEYMFEPGASRQKKGMVNKYERDTQLYIPVELQIKQKFSNVTSSRIDPPWLKFRGVSIINCNVSVMFF